jgi:hypothetical protein
MFNNRLQSILDRLHSVSDSDYFAASEKLTKLTEISNRADSLRPEVQDYFNARFSSAVQELNPGKAGALQQRLASIPVAQNVQHPKPRTPTDLRFDNPMGAKFEYVDVKF